MRITDHHLEHYRRHGFLVAEQFLTGDELAVGVSDLHVHFPTAEDFAREPERYAGLPEWVDFPFASDMLNDLATHPELLAGMERILGTDELQLGGASIGVKYAGRAGGDQDLHIDGTGVNSFLYPADDMPFGQLQIFYYLSDVSEELAPTYVVSREHTQGEFLVPPHRTRMEHPRLYELERPVLCPAGTLLIMSMRTFHRGSALRAAAGARLVMAITYHAAAARWNEDFSWPTATESDGCVHPHLRRFMERATERQREALGFPPPGHAYWDEETLRGLAARYPSMEIAPYRRAQTTRVRHPEMSESRSDE